MMLDPFVQRLKENEATLAKLPDDKVMYLALSELMAELAVGKDVLPGDKAKRISLAATLAKRAGVRF